MRAWSCDWLEQLHVCGGGVEMEFKTCHIPNHMTMSSDCSSSNRGIISL